MLSVEAEVEWTGEKSNRVKKESRWDKKKRNILLRLSPTLCDGSTIVSPQIQAPVLRPGTETQSDDFKNIYIYRKIEVNTGLGAAYEQSTVTNQNKDKKSSLESE